jgi:hypothetical protein
MEGGKLVSFYGHKDLPKNGPILEFAYLFPSANARAVLRRNTVAELLGSSTAFVRRTPSGASGSSEAVDAGWYTSLHFTC